MPIDPVSMGIAAGVNVAAPMLAKGIGSLFGLDKESSEERNAALRREAALERLRAQAEGRTPSAAQLAGIAQQQRTQQTLASLAQQGSVQQRASNARAAMRAAPEAMAQQGAQIASTRAAEMESARNALAQAQLGVATQEAAAGKANREYMQRLIGAGVQGAAAAATMGLTPEDGGASNKISEADAAAYNAANTKGSAASGDLGAAFQRSTDAMQQGTGVTSDQAAKELGFSAGTAPGQQAMAGSPLTLGIQKVASGIGNASLALGKRLAGFGGAQGQQEQPGQDMSGMLNERYGESGFVGTAMRGMRKRKSMMPGGGGGYAL